MENSTIDEELDEGVKVVRKSRRARIQEEERKESSRRKNSKNRRSNKKEKSNKISKINIIFTSLFSLGSVGIITVLILLYGPFIGFREWLVTTAMTTMTHQYFATWFYDDETIQYILDKNRVVEINETTDVNSINFANSNKVTEYENEYERAILERDENNNDYKIIEISEKSFDGYLVAVYDPSRIHTVVTENLGKSGQYLTTMEEDLTIQTLIAQVAHH